MSTAVALNKNDVKRTIAVLETLDTVKRAKAAGGGVGAEKETDNVISSHSRNCEFRNVLVKLTGSKDTKVWREALIPIMADVIV